MFGMASGNHRIRTDLGGTVSGVGYDPSRSRTVVRLVHLSDLHVVDVASPARAEWVELLGDDPRWRPLLHMHRPYEALTPLGARRPRRRDPPRPDRAVDRWCVRPRAQHRRQHRQRPAQRARRLPRDHGGRSRRSFARVVGRKIRTVTRARRAVAVLVPGTRCRRHVEAARLSGGRGVFRARRRAGHVTGRRHRRGRACLATTT